MVAKRNLKESSRAVSSVVGLLLMYSLAIIAVGIILVYNVPVLNDMQDSAKAQKIEQGFTVLDSRISKVALGEAPLQTTSVSLMGGAINVNGPGEAEKGTMRVEIINYSTYNESIDCSLGTIEYVKDDRKIAYEGGGVWSDYGSKGEVVMVSPPEFHYNGETLTLPVMSINGNTSVSGTGNTAITVTSNNTPSVFFPNKAINRSNPLVDFDVVKVYIKSDYYEAWANYANSLTQTSATLDDENKTAIISFTTQPPNGTFPLREIIPVGMINPEPEEPIEEFSFYLDAAPQKSLDSLNSELTATSGTRTLTYEFWKRKGSDTIVVRVKYTDTAAGAYEEIWDSIDYYYTVGDNKIESTIVDLTNESYRMEYAGDTEFSWNQSGPTTELPDVEISNGNISSINNLTQHYMKLITKEEPIEFKFETSESNENSNAKSDPVDYTLSTYTLKYNGLGNYLTYLHITQNELDVTVE